MVISFLQFVPDLTTVYYNKDTFKSNKKSVRELENVFQNWIVLFIYSFIYLFSIYFTLHQDICIKKFTKTLILSINIFKKILYIYMYLSLVPVCYPTQGNPVTDSSSSGATR